ncbi:hypothetical protein RHSIM_Rhsim09G0022500 [Rhododendron simsii]|uniref:RRM domain-containing protein n=1 Tax=Rhododendron simsii TaxID=118357 RepID=A0A834LF19_RHOSS|nr:hypothetical protein RHSIM_Rhsim09G0022500 [Rhododendron simsii]
MSTESETPSNNLWVGNLSSQVTHSDLMNLFSRHGDLHSVTAPNASRNYAFVCFNRIEDAKAAVEGLRGTVLRGNAIKIDFAKTAKPCKTLWVNGINPAVTKEILQEEFLKFGKIEELKFNRDRKTAYVDYFRLEDASEALKRMNGKRIGSGQIRVDYFRSRTSKRENSADIHDPREGQFLSRSMVHLDSPRMPQDVGRNYFELSKRQQHSQSSGEQKLDGQPSNVLWIGYPPSVRIDEQMLHNAMILFGEIETIKSFPSQNYACVEFRRVDEARRAKEGLQGRLFNDPRILIIYLSSDVGRSKGYAGFPPGTLWPRTDVPFTELPYQTSHMDMSKYDLPMIPNTLSGHVPFSDMLRKLSDANPDCLLGGQNWRRPSPAPAMLPSPSLLVKRPIRPVSRAWDVIDVSQLQREPKRSRIETALPVFGSPFPSKALEDRPLGLDRFGDQDHDYIWRGVIAKGGTSVCRARCVPIGEGIKSEIPDVVNCSVKTGFHVLAKHCTEAMGFTVVYFLPDSEEDFGSYTEFLQYLGKNEQAEVAIFDDGTALFLVPPSDFLSKVLNVTGPERLYGVVLKSPHHNLSSTSMQPQSQSQYMNSQQKHSKIESSGMPQKEEKDLHMDCNTVLCNDSLHLTKQLAPSTIESLPTPVNTVAMSQSRVNLTPEPIATLPSFVPSSAKASGSKSALLPLVSSSMRPPLLLSADLDRGLLPQGSKFDFQGNKLTTHQIHEAENRFNPQGEFSQLQTDTASLNTSISSPMVVTGKQQFHDPTFNLPQQGAVSSRPWSNFGIPAQSGQHQYGVPENFDKDFRTVQGTDFLGSYGSSSSQHRENSVTMSNQVYDSNVAQTYTAMPLAADKGNSAFWKVPRSDGDGASQGTSEVEDDKTQRYLSTLQLAANILLQRQKQQQPSTQAGQRSANPEQDFHQLDSQSDERTGQPINEKKCGGPPPWELAVSSGAKASTGSPRVEQSFVDGQYAPIGGNFMEILEIKSDSELRKKKGTLSIFWRTKLDGQLSHVLWIGYPLSVRIGEQMLHNGMETIRSFPSQDYSCVEFRSVDDARRAKGLQSYLFDDPRISIINEIDDNMGIMWSGCESSAVTKEILQEEFLKFGKIEEFKFNRDHKTAYVDYFRLEDASEALKKMNGKRIGSDQIRENSSDNRDLREGQFLSRTMVLLDSPRMPQDVGGNYSELSKRQQLAQLSGEQKLDGQPSNVLWIGFPPSVHIDEQMLHNAMILFGEIETIRSFPSQNYSCVEFRRVAEAKRAKEGLQGCLFNNLRISIMYLSSDVGRSKVLTLSLARQE